jgi:HK97 family phage prohead protease
LKNKPNKNEVARRYYPITDLRAALDPAAKDDGQTVEGHAAVYGQMTPIGCWFNEIIEPGAFDGTDLTDVLFFVNHETDKIPLARSRLNNRNSTMQLTVDSKGLYFNAVLDTENNAESKSLYSSVNRGDITGMSFCFYVQEEEWDKLDTDMPTRHVTKIGRVSEISAVNSPAYPGADINASARDQEALDSAKIALDSARSSLDSDKNDAALLALQKEKLKLRR